MLSETEAEFVMVCESAVSFFIIDVSIKFIYSSQDDHSADSYIVETITEWNRRQACTICCSFTHCNPNLCFSE